MAPLDGGQAAAVSLFLIATAADLSIPWASGALIDAVSAPERVSEAAWAAWAAWAALSGLYFCFYMLRTGGFRILNGF
ncbi:MAG TPA: hypothetical protein PKB04_11090 [Phenylobacterium sp.]|nr:hypothetical protein [Phenylobacterium sp.]